MRVSRWADVDAPPEPLRAAVSKLPERLGTANRLAAGTFVGTPTDMRTVTAICKQMKQLDAAYVAYRKRLESKPESTRDAVEALDADIAEAAGAALQ